MPMTEDRVRSHTNAMNPAFEGLSVAEIAAALERLGFSVREADETRIQEWLDDSHDAFNEDLSRILLGEAPMYRNRSQAQAPSVEDFLRRARPLMEELVKLSRRLD